MKTSPKTEKDSAKLKEERAELVSHLYSIIGTTRDNSYFCNTDSNTSTYCVSESPSDSDQWPDSNLYDELYDHGLELRGRKTSTFYQTKRHSTKPKNKLDDRRIQNSALNKNQKKTRRNEFYKKRKKELVLARKEGSNTKFENLSIIQDTFESEYEFWYLDERNFETEKSGLKFTLCDENAPEELQSDLLDFLLDLQDREVTPEDYEFLLQLDESVPTKTVSDERVASLKTDTVLELHVDETCGVCMENYVVGETRKILPCGHVFHASCIETWLTHNSTKCPLDNIEV